MVVIEVQRVLGHPEATPDPPTRVELVKYLSEWEKDVPQMEDLDV